MFRHHDVSQNDESVPSAHLLQNFEKQVASGGNVQKRFSVVTTEGQKVQVPSAISAMKFLGHGWRLEGLGLLCL